MKVQFTEAEMAELKALEERYEERMKNALERIAPFHGDNSGDDLKTQYRRYLKGLDDDSKKALREYDNALIEATRERGKLLSRFMAESVMIGSEAETLENILTTYPANFITPIDKISNHAFEGIFKSNEKAGVIVFKESKTQKPIYNFVTINYDNLNYVLFDGKKELGDFDREVHDAITTLYVEGNNEYVTINMIYQIITGRRRSRYGSHSTPIQKKEIMDSVTRLMYTGIVIDSSEEAKKKGYEKGFRDSALINAKRENNVLINGQVTTAIHILAPPILYEHAKERKQIGRFKVGLLDSPIKRKSKDTIILEGYLRRRILGMKGKSKLSPTIKYDTVYKHLEVTAGSEASLRNKKKKVRDYISVILEHYKKQGFIKGYTENKDKSGGRKKQSITIKI